MKAQEIAHIQDEARRAALREAMAACERIADEKVTAYARARMGARACALAVEDLLNDPKGGA